MFEKRFLSKIKTWVEKHFAPQSVESVTADLQKVAKEQKFKTFEEARQSLWCYHPTKEYYRRLEDFWNTIELLNPRPNCPQGIQKFKTFEEAQASGLHSTTVLSKVHF